MNGESDTTTAYGINSRFGWPIAGALGGALGAVVFGLLAWIVDPEIIEAAIPSIYGLDPEGVVGWTIHVLHGVVLGLIFGFLVTRDVVLGILRTDVETDAIAGMGLTVRLTAAGFVFGLAVWAILPLLVLPVWTQMIGIEPAANFPGIAAVSLFGHLVFGLVLGAVFAAGIDLSDRPSGEPLEE